MDRWALNVQYKNRVIHKIRPATWYSKNKRYPLFESLEHYLSAIEETLFRYPDTHGIVVGWKKRWRTHILISTGHGYRFRDGTI